MDFLCPYLKIFGTDQSMLGCTSWEESLVVLLGDLVVRKREAHFGACIESLQMNSTGKMVEEFLSLAGMSYSTFLIDDDYQITRVLSAHECRASPLGRSLTKLAEPSASRCRPMLGRAPSDFIPRDRHSSVVPRPGFPASFRDGKTSRKYWRSRS